MKEVFGLLKVAALLTLASTKNNNLSLKACREEDGYYKCPHLRSDPSCIERQLFRDLKSDCRIQSEERQAPLNCTDDEFQCRVTLRCIPRYLLNTKLSCTQNEGTALPCRANDEFTCPLSKKCIPRWMVMDGNDDCHTMLVKDRSDEEIYLSHCKKNEFRCSTNQTIPSRSRCIPREWVRDQVEDCPNGTDEKSLLQCQNDEEFLCKTTGQCIPRYRVLDGYPDCPDKSDEKQPLTCISSKEFRCHDNGRCIPRSWRGDTLFNCLDGSDELPMLNNETCVDGEFRCKNNKRCIPLSLLCDGMDHCSDCSDEIESCHEPRMIRCPNQLNTCVLRSYSCDAYTDCPSNAEDVTSGLGFKCFQNVFGNANQNGRYCVIPQWSLTNSYSSCDDKSDICYKNGTFQCSYCFDKKTIIAPRQICDGVVDCPDFSDECLCSSRFIGSRDSSAFCSSLCYNDNSESCSHCASGELWCKEENLCLAREKVCDGKNDCPVSFMDEISCKRKIVVNTTIPVRDFQCDIISEGLDQMITGYNLNHLRDLIVPSHGARCDGITECLNFEDECSERANCSVKSKVCETIPLKNVVIPKGFAGNSAELRFTQRKCSGWITFVFGNSICNGIQECDKNEDEVNCSKRFECKVGKVQWLNGDKDVVSIPSSEKCDAQWPPDCLDQSDEKNCSSETHFYCENGKPLFVPREKVLDGQRDCSDFSDECPKNFTSSSGLASREEMIQDQVLRVIIWFGAILAMLGNAAVIATNLKEMLTPRQKKVKQRASMIGLINKVLIINLALSDFIMGLALLIIGVKMIQFSGYYCILEKTWRTSSTCNFIGVLTVLSSEASVFTLVCLTTYRLYSIYNPFESRDMKLKYLFLWIVLIWTLAFLLALLPFAKLISTYMITGILISTNSYFFGDVASWSEYKIFAQRITYLKSNGTSGRTLLNDWFDVDAYLSTNFPDISPQNRGYFGYYSSSSVCIPKFYRITGDQSHFNVMSSAVITFNFISLIYILFAYLSIYYRSTSKGPTQFSSIKSATKKSHVMQRKITILIGTDFCCWMPICVMTFLSMAGVSLSPIAYAVSAIVLLPINSSINPIIYTDIVPTVWKLFKQRICVARSNVSPSMSHSNQSSPFPADHSGTIPTRLTHMM